MAKHISINYKRLKLESQLNLVACFGDCVMCVTPKESVSLHHPLLPIWLQYHPLYMWREKFKKNLDPGVTLSPHKRWVSPPIRPLVAEPKVCSARTVGGGAGVQTPQKFPHPNLFLLNFFHLKIWFSRYVRHTVNHIAWQGKTKVVSQKYQPNVAPPPC